MLPWCCVLALQYSFAPCQPRPMPELIGVNSWIDGYQSHMVLDRQLLCVYCLMQPVVHSLVLLSQSQKLSASHVVLFVYR